jgi:hypothetical protein
MKKLHRLVLLAAVIFFLISPQVFGGDSENVAIRVAREWLALVDANKYGESWQ